MALPFIGKHYPKPALHTVFGALFHSAVKQARVYTHRKAGFFLDKLSFFILLFGKYLSVYAFPANDCQP